jgi:UDP-2-acetamido-2,6-beta-L-arabino-hexul-4-ose reductase
MKIGITGADGFLGFHVRAYLHALNIHEVRLAKRETFSSRESLEEFVSGLDAIIHLAGVNRGDDKDLFEGNVGIAEQLVAAMDHTASTPILLYANSTHAEKETAYGIGKRQAGEVFFRWAGTRGTRFINIILPHVFGEFGRPFYNSAVSTFCYQIANGEEPEIHTDSQLELVHAQDMARRCLSIIQEVENGFQNKSGMTKMRLSGVSIKVSKLLSLLRDMQTTYVSQVVPDLSCLLHLQLFNTLRSYLYPQHYPNFLLLRTDNRGTLFEAVKTMQCGQTFISSSKSGVTRGNHFHLRKVERFLVLQGDAEIKIRKLFSNEIKTFIVSGKIPSYIDIPTFHTHSITNLGASELMTLFWSNEIFDANDSDTFSEQVLV